MDDQRLALPSSGAPNIEDLEALEVQARKNNAEAQKTRSDFINVILELKTLRKDIDLQLIEIQARAYKLDLQEEHLKKREAQLEAGQAQLQKDKAQMFESRLQDDRAHTPLADSIGNPAAHPNSGFGDFLALNDTFSEGDNVGTRSGEEREVNNEASHEITKTAPDKATVKAEPPIPLAKNPSSAQPASESRLSSQDLPDSVVFNTASSQRPLTQNLVSCATLPNPASKRSRSPATSATEFLENLAAGSRDISFNKWHKVQTERTSPEREEAKKPESETHKNIDKSVVEHASPPPKIIARPRIKTYQELMTDANGQHRIQDSSHDDQKSEKTPSESRDRSKGPLPQQDRPAFHSRGRGWNKQKFAHHGTRKPKSYPQVRPQHARPAFPEQYLHNAVPPLPMPPGANYGAAQHFRL